MVPGVFLLRGGMIEFGMVLLLMGVLVLSQAAALEELRSIRRGVARLAVRAERVSVGGEGADSLRDQAKPGTAGLQGIRELEQVEGHAR